MNYYESMVVFNPDLSETELKEENQKFADLIAKLNGEIVKTDYFGKRTLAYLIKKKREGHYLVNYFKIPPKELGKLENFYHLADNILRYNILRKHSLDS